MIGAAIGAGISAIGSLFGGMSAASKARRAERELNSQKMENENWWRMKSSEDYTKSASAQSALRRAKDMYDRSIQSASGAAAVSGASDYAEAQAKKAASHGIADTTSNIAVNGENLRNSNEQQYLQKKGTLADKYYNLYMQKAQNSTNAANQAMKAGMSMIASDQDAMSSIFGGNTKIDLGSPDMTSAKALAQQILDDAKKKGV